MRKIIDGKQIASKLLDELKGRIRAFRRPIGLAFLLAGDNPASETYVRMKKKACAEIGIQSRVETFAADERPERLLKKIEELNLDPTVDGILVQLPLPPQFDTLQVTRSIDPSKDVDGFHPVNLGKLLLGEEGGFLPCTPRGIQVLLEQSKIPVEGKRVAIVGRSNIVGKPLALILAQKKQGCNATVTIAHSQSEHLAEITRSADVLVAAIGQPRFIKAPMVKEGAAVIDVGINRFHEEGKARLVGDVDFEHVAPVASRITPVPGGVGPMTIAMLMQNTLESALRRG